MLTACKELTFTFVTHCIAACALTAIHCLLVRITRILPLFLLGQSDRITFKIKIIKIYIELYSRSYMVSCHVVFYYSELFEESSLVQKTWIYYLQLQFCSYATLKACGIFTHAISHFSTSANKTKVILSLVVRKPAFGVSDQVRHKPGCTIKEDG